MRSKSQSGHERAILNNLVRIFVLASTYSQAQRLAALFEEDERIEVIGTADAARFRATRKTPLADVLLVSGHTPDAVSEAEVPVVLLSDRELDENPLSKTVRACLPEQSSAAEIAAAITAASADLMVLTDAQARQWLRPGLARDTGRTFMESLTARELQVLRMLADGLSNKEIAPELGISDHTVKFHVAQILAKLGVGSRTEAVRLAIRRGLVPI
ncbi:MAG: response regulator transcription factor [Acidobacteriaceae bacterium]|nr:response regulator transcription factor [Acidobacteriaceae bacterium]